MKITLKNSLFYLFLLAIIGFKLYSDFLKADDFKKDMIQNQVISKCVIIDAKYSGKSSTTITYTYIVDGKKYKGEYVSRDISSSINTEIKGKIMPLIYSKKNPDHSSLLLRVNNFKNYNLFYPDSLNWINKFDRTY